MILNTENVFFLDLQTTGATPKHGSILEIAWGTLSDPTTSFLVKQPEDARLPHRIKILTGIKDDDMGEAVSLKLAIKEFQKFIKRSSRNNAICIIHFAQFEKNFLCDVFKKGIPFPIICTHEVAKRLFPNLPSRGIKGLAGYYGDNTSEFKRASSHVEATKIIWQNLLLELNKIEIKTYEDLIDWLVLSPKRVKTKYEYPLPKEKRLFLPEAPGIYRMLNKKGEVLYVGKATSLKSRVNSYFRGQKGRDSKKLEMLAQVYDLHITQCESPLHAALLETDEIKKLAPYYNIALKVGHRSLSFFNYGFTSQKNAPDSEHFLGPFPGIVVFESMFNLISYVDNVNVQAYPDEFMFYDRISPDLIKSGLEVFCFRHSFKLEWFSSMRNIIYLGTILYRKSSRIEVLDEINEVTMEEFAERELIKDLNKEDVADKFERHFIRVSLAYFRASKISVLINSIIEVKMENGECFNLFIKDGNISNNQNNEERTLDCWGDQSINTYDRMTVLWTELQKIKKNNGEYKVTSNKKNNEKVSSQ